MPGNDGRQVRVSVCQYQPVFDLRAAVAHCLFQVLLQRSIGRFLRVLRIERWLTARWPLVKEAHTRRSNGFA
jgi:hypothetical protein